MHPLVTGQMKAGATAKDPVDSGEMWECPDFFPLDGKHLLILSTERVVKYLLGSYTGSPASIPDTMGGIDYGSYYAARTMTNTGDRRILWGWMTEGAQRRGAAGGGLERRRCRCRAN